ncbi:MAG: citrate/2-methylcitrate synthase, partial [Oscillospiraceae bacterium]
VYTISDPRAVILKERAEYLAVQTGNEKEFKLHDLIERLAPVAFREIKGIDKAMCANVDFYSGFVYQMLGIPQELITPIFAMSRI